MRVLLFAGAVRQTVSESHQTLSEALVDGVTPSSRSCRTGTQHWGGGGGADRHQSETHRDPMIDKLFENRSLCHVRRACLNPWCGSPPASSHCSQIQAAVGGRQASTVAFTKTSRCLSQAQFSIFITHNNCRRRCMLRKS